MAHFGDRSTHTLPKRVRQPHPPRVTFLSIDEAWEQTKLPEVVDDNR